MASVRSGSRRRRRRSSPVNDALETVWRVWDPREALRRAWSPANQTRTAIFASALLLLVVATLFGGASQTNALSLMGVELASLPLLFMALYLIFAAGLPARTLLPLAVLIAVAAIPILQLIPLPAGIWAQLPGRGPVLQALDAAGLGRPALPFSLAPQEAWRSALALAPPAAMFLGALLLSDRQRRFMAGCWLVLAVVSLCIGALQLLGGAGSPFYFYEITNPGSAVGLFANRNHQAAFLLCLIPVAAIFAARFTGEFDNWRAMPPLFAVLYFFVAIVGVAVTHSRAGVFLLGAALLGSVAVLFRAGALRRQWRATVGVGVGSGVAILAVLMLGLSPILARFNGAPDPRFEDWPIVLAAARSFLPLGSGVGSFQSVYESVEPLTHVSPIYFNHAHNDFLELWLETGLVGAAVFLVFAVWLATRIWAIWRSRAASAADLPAACTLLTLLLIVHSTVDYPLRTEALAVLFAFACGTIAAYSRRDAEAAAAKSAQRGGGRRRQRRLKP